MSVEREVMLVMMAGAPGTGKTSLAMEFVHKLGRNRALIIDPDGLEDKWKIFPKIDLSKPEQIKNLKGPAWAFALENPEEMFENLYKNFRDGLLVLDDCRVYMKSNAETSLRNMLRRKRQMMADIVCAAHGFTEIPPAFFPFATHYVVFRTMDNIGLRKQQLNPFTKFEQIVNRVNQKAASDKYYREFFSQKTLYQ